MHATDAARPLSQAAVRYVIDHKTSTFTVRAFSEGLLAVFGHNPRIAIREFEGEVQFTPGSAMLQDVSMQLRIRAGSLEVTDDVSDKDRREMQRQMYEEVLETDRYPEILYECSSVSANGSSDGRYWATLNGELTLHGVTHAMPLPARVVVNGNSLRATGEFSVRQSDYDIALVSVAAGAVRIKDELKFSFDIVARKQG